MKPLQIEKNPEKDVPIIENEMELSGYLQDIYVIEHILISTEVFDEFYDKIQNLVRATFDIWECRTHNVKFKFYQKDEKVYEMFLPYFMVNLIFWGPFVHVNHVKFLNEYFVIDCDKFIESPDYDIEPWINRRIIPTLRNFNVRQATIDPSLSKLQSRLRQLSIDFSLMINLNFSYFTFKYMYDKYPRIREIMEYKFPTSMNSREIELKIAELLKEEIDIYKKDVGNPIGLIMMARTGMKDKQFGEFTIAQGYKPTVDGTIMTIPIENSTLIRGLDRPSYLYIDSSAARKSLILNKTVMGKAGNFGKLVMELARTLGLSKKVTDCGTTHYIHIEIRNKKMLRKVDNRFYKVNNSDELSIIDSERDTHLIGKTIKMRSPVTCALKNDCVCARCFGKTAGLNYDIADGAAAFESEEVTKELEQNVLSSKHLLTTESEVLEFNAEFDMFFELMNGEVYPNKEGDDVIDDIDKYAIYIPPEIIAKADSMDDDSPYNTFIDSNYFYVVNMETNKMTEIRLKNENKPIFLTDDAINLRKKGKGFIKFKELEDDMKIFEIDILNNELTKPLYDMMALFNRKRKKDEPNTIDEVCQRFIDLLVISGIGATSLAGECIINRLVRSVADPYSRPDFSKKTIEPYEIITVGKALEENKSPTLGLGVQYVRRQLLSDDIITKRKGTSYMDAFMRTDIPNLYEKLYGDGLHYPEPTGVM